MPMTADASGTPLNAPTGGGLLSGLDPDYQAEVAKAGFARQQLRQATAFQGGLPTDAQGNTDYAAAANKLFQLGDYANAGKLLQTGFQLDAMNRLQGQVDPFAGGQPAAGGPRADGATPSAAASGGGAMVPFRNAIASIESGGSGDYAAQGPTLKNGDFAVGRYQVMASNVPSWTKEVLGRAMRPDEFAADPAAQDRVFDAKFGGYLRQTGSPQDAASMWFTGQPLQRGAGRQDALGTTGTGYVGRFMAALAGQRPAGMTPSAGGNAPAAPLPTLAQAGAPPAPALVQNGAMPAAAPRPPAQQAAAPAVPPQAGPVTDSQYQAALRIATQAENMDPRQMSPADQNAATVAAGLVDRYRREQATPVAASATTPAGDPAAPVQVAQNGASDAPSAVHPFGPGAPGLQRPAAPAQPQPPQPQPQPAQPAPGAPAQTVLQANLAADPTMGGLLGSGVFRGRPADAINFLRNRAAQYSIAGMEGAAKNDEARAQNIERTLERMDQPTPEQKNARDPAAVAYEQGRTQFAQDVKDRAELANAGPLAAARAQAELDVKGSPQAIRLAGQTAAATAGGTAQGQAPYDLVPTQPQPGGPVVQVPKSDVLSGAAPGVKSQPPQFAEQQRAIAANEAAMQGQFQARQVAKERIDAMSNLLSTVETGYGTPAFSDAVAKARAVGFNIPDSVAANPAAVQQFGKNATANIFASMKEMGGKVLVSEMDGLKQSNANASLQPAANQAILAQQRGIIDREDAYFDAYTDWKRANPYAVGNDVARFDADWSKANPVSGFVAAAKKNIAPLGVAVPAPAQREVGQRYAVPGKGVFRWMGNGWSPN